MPDCESPQRRRLVQHLIGVSTAAASQELLERGLAEGNRSLITNSLNMLEKALGGSGEGSNSQNDIQHMEDAWNTNLTWTGTHFTKTVENVLAKGMPLPVKSGQCSIEMCPTCFWENICDRESTSNLINHIHQLVEEIKAQDAASREMTAWRQKLELIKQQPILNAAEELQRQREEDQFQREKEEFWKRHPRVAF
jgi:hypothetical protein